MKRLLLVAALSSMVWMSCSKDDAVYENDQAMISFTPAVYQTQSRGIIDGTVYDGTDPSFYAWAWYGNLSDGSNTARFMEKELITFSDPDWIPQKDYYWPQTGVLDFFCASPSYVVPEVKINPPSLSYDNLAIDPTASAYEYDIMYSERTINRTHNQTGSVYTGVPIRFHHALTQVRFQVRQENFTDSKPVQGGNMETSWTIKIKKCSLTNLKTKGSLELQTQGNTSWLLPEGAVWTADVSDMGKEWTLYDTAGELLTGTNGNGVDLVLKDYHLVMPQKLYAGATDEVENEKDMVLNLTYLIQTSTKIDGKEITTDEVEKTYSQRLKDIKKTSDPMARLSSWEINKKILYTIVFDPLSSFEKITFAPAVIDWEGEPTTVKPTV